MVGKAFLAAMLGLGLAFPAAATETPPASAPPALTAQAIPYDPLIRRGVLPNGLRYAVMRADRPGKTLSLRLGIGVGGFDEADPDQGVAHFIEHMAFRSTRAFPDNAIDGAFSPRGVAFGRDHNAETGLFSTQFQLDLPTVDEDDSALGFTWLRNVADGVQFTPGAIAKEQGVVLAEKETDDDPERAAQEALLAFQTPGLRSSARVSVGDEAVLRGLTPARLQAFYDRWYRPDNAVVVVVGDLPLDTLEAKVRAAFSSWTGRGPDPAREPARQPDLAAGPAFFTRSDPALTASALVCRLTPPDPRPPNTVGQLRTEALGLIWRSALNQRLTRLRTDPAASVIGAFVSAEDNRHDLRATCLEVIPLLDSWRPALRAAQRELRRFAEAGPTDLEVETAIDDVRGHLRGDVTDAPNRTAAALASHILEQELDGEVASDPRQAIRAYDLAVEDISAADVRAAFARDWSGAGPMVSVLAPNAPDKDALAQAWAATEREPPLPAYADGKTGAWAYDFGKPGVVAKREVIPEGGFLRFTFRNGLVFNLKTTPFAKNGVYLAVRFGTGRREIEDQDYLAATFGADLFPMGGTGKHSFEDVGKILGEDARQFDITIADQGFYISGEETRPNLEQQMLSLAAYLNDPAFSSAADPHLRQAVEVLYRSGPSDPDRVASEALMKAIGMGEPFILPPKSKFDGLNNAQIARILKPAITQAPLEVTLVGDISEQDAVPMIASALGALPPRIAAARPQADVRYLRFPPGPPVVVRAAHDGPTDKAVAEVVWPLYVAEPARRREEYSLQLLAAIMSDAVRHRVRGDLAKTYSPTVSSHLPDHADQGQLTAIVESYPADIDVLVDEIRLTAKRLAGGDITAEQLEAARAPILAAARRAMTSNRNWADGISGSSIDDTALRDVIAYPDLIASLTLADVKAAAARWLTQAPDVAIAAPRQTAQAHP